MTQSPGFEVQGESHKTCSLEKTIYGLKQFLKLGLTSSLLS